MKNEEAVEVISVEGQEVRITNPEKPYFSKETRLSKLDLVNYYLAIAPGALLGIADRPIVLKRFVNGAEGEASTRSARLRIAHPGSEPSRCSFHPGARRKRLWWIMLRGWPGL